MPKRRILRVVVAVLLSTLTVGCAVEETPIPSAAVRPIGEPLPLLVTRVAGANPRSWYSAGGSGQLRVENSYLLNSSRLDTAALERAPSIADALKASRRSGDPVFKMNVYGDNQYVGSFLAEKAGDGWVLHQGGQPHFDRSIPTLQRGLRGSPEELVDVRVFEMAALLGRRGDRQLLVFDTYDVLGHRGRKRLDIDPYHGYSLDELRELLQSADRSAEDTQTAARRLLPEAIRDLRIDGYLPDEATESLKAGVPTAIYDLGRKPVKSADYFSQMVADEADAIVHVPVMNGQEVLGEFEMRRSRGVWILEGSGGGPSDRFATARRQLATAGFARGESRQVMTRWGLALFVRQGDRVAAVFLQDSPWLPKGAVEAQKPEAGDVYSGADLWRVLGPAAPG